MPDKPRLVWFEPPQATRFHVFGEDNRALCGRWWHPRAQELGDLVTPDQVQQKSDCAGCWKALKKLDAG